MMACRILFLGLLSFCLLFGLIDTTSAQGEVAMTNNNGRALSTVGHGEAFVSLLYGQGYLLPVRVLMNSVKQTHTTRDRVVLVTPDVSEIARETLRGDGVIVKVVDPIKNPYDTQTRYDPKFGPVMAKLSLFSLTEYETIVYLDADALVLDNIDELFGCGSFCAAFLNPCIFNSGVMVVKPQQSVFEDMVAKLQSGELSSYDGGDQGFLNSYFGDLLTAPLFKPLEPEPILLEGETRIRRLDMGFHLDPWLYYQRMQWEVPCGKKKIMEFLGLKLGKPWMWWSYWFMDLSWQWRKHRLQLVPYHTPEIDPETSTLAFLYLFPLVLVAVCFRYRAFARSALDSFFKKLPQWTTIADSAFLTWCIIVGYAQMFTAFWFSYYFIPDTTDPIVAYGILLTWKCSLTSIFVYLHLCWVEGRRDNRRGSPAHSPLYAVVFFAVELLLILMCVRSQQPPTQFAYLFDKIFWLFPYFGVWFIVVGAGYFNISAKWSGKATHYINP